MIGTLYIDDIDVYSAFGIFIVKGGYNEIIQWASLKEPMKNDWPEEDGIEVDLLEPVLDSRQLKINFACLELGNLSAFFNLLGNGAAHSFNFVEIGKTYSLRLASQAAKKVYSDSEVFSLTFIEDMPFQGYIYNQPTNFNIESQNYKIDGVDLSDYGLYVLEGTRESVYKAAEIKENLIIKSVYSNGQIYDNEKVFYKSKDAVLNLFLVAPDLATFWVNYEAFLYDLIQPNERILSSIYTNRNYPFYYKSSSVEAFGLTEGEVWCKFSVTICITSSRPTNVLRLFATEDGRVVASQNGYAIDLTY